MSKKLIGIEIGSDTIKLSLVSEGKLLGAAIARMPDNLVLEGRVTAPATMSQLIKDLCKELGTRPGPCAFVLPSQGLIIRTLTMPVMSDKELALNLPYEFKDYVGRDADGYVYDYAVTNVTDSAMELYAVAASKEVIATYSDILAKAGMKVKAMVPQEAAWLNLLRGAKNLPGTVCLVDLGHRSTRVSIYIGGKFAMSRNIELAGHNLSDVISRAEQVDIHVARNHKESNLDNCLSSDAASDFYSSLAVEIMRTVIYFKTNFKDAPELTDIYYCGGSAKNEALRNAILKQNNLVMHHVARLVNTDMKNEDLILTCALSAGAAMQV